MRKSEITKIEKHYYENANHTVRMEYRVYAGLLYEVKSFSQLNKGEKESLRDKSVQVFHF